MIEKGLTNEEVKKLQEKYGKNELTSEKKKSFFIKIIHIICEPMFLLLILAATIYFVLGEPRDGIIMLVFVIGIISIDIIQEWKTDKTLNALKDLSEPKITVLRESQKIEIPSSELVPGDIMYINEGVKIPADGFVIKCSGLKVDESSLTGESINVWKTTKEYKGSDYWRNDYCYQGTLVTGGTGVIKVDKTGTITKNQMEVVEVITNKYSEEELSTLMCLSSEEQTYDPMEKAIFKYAKKLGINKTDIFNGEKLKEYPFSDETKIMGSVWKKNNKIILAAKGSPESIINLCDVNEKEIENNLLKLQEQWDY